MDSKTEKKAGVDIINIDSKIIAHFEKENTNLVDYKSRLKELHSIANNIKDRSVFDLIYIEIDTFNEKIEAIENNSDYTFYLLESIPILERYKKILQTPVKINFTGIRKALLNDIPTAHKETSINEYLQIAKKYIKYIIDFDINILQKEQRQTCESCSSKKIVDDNMFVICEDCGFEKETRNKALTYKPIMNQKYIEERKNHFRDCINQFQGKQNSKIDAKVFKDLEGEFTKHNMLVGDSTMPKELRYAKVKFEHIMMFLKELGLDKQYDNAKYIYNVLAGAKCPDLSKIEDQLLNDFDILVNLYIKKYKYEGKIERKSFLSVQYLLMALLKKNKFPCEKEDFINILKTNDRKAFHDDITKDLFNELSWNFTPLF